MMKGIEVGGIEQNYPKYLWFICWFCCGISIWAIGYVAVKTLF